MESNNLNKGENLVEGDVVVQSYECGHGHDRRADVYEKACSVNVSQVSCTTAFESFDLVRRNKPPIVFFLHKPT